MNHTQIDLVQRTFAQASRIAPHLASTFYAELFAIEPALRRLFTGDMITQGEKLMAMLERLVTHLADPEAVRGELRELALRHVSYGVEARHYTLVGTALLRTLQHELGRDFTPEARAAWSEAYKILAAIMRDAAYGPAPERGV